MNLLFAYNYKKKVKRMYLLYLYTFEMKGKRKEKANTIKTIIALRTRENILSNIENI